MANWLRDWLETSELSRFPIVRRATSAVHVGLPNGEMVATCLGVPIHYRDSAGEWQALDTALRSIDGAYGAPGVRVRIGPDGAVLDRQSGFWERNTAVGVVDVEGRFRRLARLGVGRVDGDALVQECGAFRLVTRAMPDGAQQDLHVDAHWGGCCGAGERLAVAGVWGGNRRRVHFGTALTADGRLGRIHWTRGSYVVEAPPEWSGGVLDPTFSGGTTDKYIYGNNATYSTARNTSSADVTSPSVLRVGQNTGYYCYRSFLLFDTSSLIDSKVLISAKLNMYVSVNAGGSWMIETVSQNWSAQTREQAYDGALAGSLDANWRGMSGATAGNWYTGTPLTLTNISKTGTTYYSLRSAGDAGGVAPSGAEYLDLGSGYGVTYAPQLRVTYPSATRALLGVGN